MKSYFRNYIKIRCCRIFSLILLILKIFNVVESESSSNYESNSFSSTNSTSLSSVNVSILDYEDLKKDFKSSFPIRVKNLRASALKSSLEITSLPNVQLRPNVVKENPSLDVGPLIEVTVSEGDDARLPCTHQPLNTDDSERLVLWYKNDTSRPFLSYDARSNSITSQEKDVHVSSLQNSFHGLQKSSLMDSKKRIFLAEGGSSLVIKGVRTTDQAEYRCKVHYSHSPSVASRLKLVVTNAAHLIYLLDSSDRPIGDHVGPLSEGSHLSLTCKAKYKGELESLEWLVNGKPIASSWTRTEDNLVLSNLELPLSRDHAHATLTCRLNSNHPNNEHGIKASIMDASTTILMYYVPQATLIIDSAASEGFQASDESKGGILRVTEGVTVTFICAVKARPPPYNISWLHNGRIIGSGGRRWAKHNSSLVVSPVNKDDTGLYTCLASNTEGDGQSNAVNLRVSHAPYCKGPARQQVIITRNATATLACEVEAEPNDATFTWTFDPAKNYARPTSVYSPNMQIYAPHSSPKEKKLTNIHKLISPTYKTDPKNPLRSLLTITPENNVQGVVCYAKNQIGRMQVPCAFSLSFVDPPEAPKDCSVTIISSSEMQVSCSSTEDKMLHLKGRKPQTPGISYVMSPEAKTASHLEMWSRNMLFQNLSGDKPLWLIEDLPPDTDFMLKIYSTSSHAVSDPVILYTRTKPRYLTSVQATANSNKSLHEPSPLDPNAESSSENVPQEQEAVFGILGLIFSLVGGIGAMLFLLILSIFFLKRRGRRRQQPPPTKLTASEHSSSIIGVSSIKAESTDVSEIQIETAA